MQKASNIAHKPINHTPLQSTSKKKAAEPTYAATAGKIALAALVGIAAVYGIYHCCSNGTTSGSATPLTDKDLNPQNSDKNLNPPREDLIDLTQSFKDSARSSSLTNASDAQVHDLTGHMIQAMSTADQLKALLKTNASEPQSIQTSS